MLHAKLVRSPYAHARIVRVDTRAAAAAPAVRVVVGCGDLTGCDPYFGPAFRDRPDTRRRRRALRGRAGGRRRGRRRGRRAGGADARRRRVRRAAVGDDARGGAGARRPARPHRQPLAGHFADLSTLRPSPARTSATSSTSSAGRVAAALAEARSDPRGHLHLPARAALLDGAARGRRRLGRAGGADGVGLDAESVLGARRAGEDVRRAVEPDPHRRAAARRRLRRQDVREARADRRRAGPHDRPPGAPGDLGRGGVPHGATLRRARARAARLHARRSHAGRRSARRTSTSAPTPTSGRASSRRATYTATGPYRVPHAALDSTRGLHEHDAGRRLPRLRRAAARVGDRVAARRGRAARSIATRSICGARTCSPTARSSRRATRRSTASSRRALNRAARGHPLDAGRRAADRGRGVAMMMKASIAPSVSEAIVRLHADGSATVLASTVEMGQGARTVIAQIAAEVLARAVDARDGGGARHRHHALRPDDELEPFHHDDGPRGAGGRRRHPRRSSCTSPPGALGVAGGAAASRRRACGRRRGGAVLSRSVLARAVRDGRRRAHRPWRRRAGADAARRSAAARRSGRWPSAPPRSRVDEETGAITVEQYVSVADVGRVHQPAAVRGAGRGRGDAGPRPHAARGDGLRPAASC